MASLVKSSFERRKDTLLDHLRVVIGVCAGLTTQHRLLDNPSTGLCPWRLGLGFVPTDWLGCRDSVPDPISRQDSFVRRDCRYQVVTSYDLTGRGLPALFPGEGTSDSVEALFDEYAQRTGLSL